MRNHDPCCRCVYRLRTSTVADCGNSNDSNSNNSRGGEASLRSGNGRHPATGRTVNFTATRTTPSGRSRWPSTPSYDAATVVTTPATSAATAAACTRLLTGPTFSASRLDHPRRSLASGASRAGERESVGLGN